MHVEFEFHLKQFQLQFIHYGVILGIALRRKKGRKKSLLDAVVELKKIELSSIVDYTTRTVL